MNEPTNANHSIPNIVARLMGIERLPSDARPRTKPMNRRYSIGEKDNAKNHPTLFSIISSKNVKEWEHDFPSHGCSQDPNEYHSGLELAKFHSREHPQEEQLQKFKKEFEAWQASEARENSRSLELKNKFREKNTIQTPSHENLLKQMMMAHCGDSRRIADQWQMEPEVYSSLNELRPCAQKIDDMRHQEYKSKPRRRSKNHEFTHTSLMNDEKFGRSLSTRTVLLKPGQEWGDETAMSCTGSPEMLEDQNSTEVFLKKVKERLNLELKGNARRDTFIRKHPLREQPIDPKEIAQLIAKKVRENVVRELKLNLPRRESNGLCRSEWQLHGLGSPKVVDEDEETFSMGQMRTVLRKEKDVDCTTLPNRSSLASMLCFNDRLMPREDDPESENLMRHWAIMKEGHGVKTRPVRHDHRKDDKFSTTELLPRNLVRPSVIESPPSLKALSNKPDVLQSVLHQRKQEATKEFFVEERKTSKHRLGFRAKVSNLRYRFNLRGKLFGRKINSVDESEEDEIDIMTAFMTEPSYMRNIGSAQENSTEVPPSPASICSSPQREFSRVGYHPSPVSTFDTPYAEEQRLPQVFWEISSNLHELRRKLDQLQINVSQEAVQEDDPSELKTVDFESEEQNYIRDVLIAAGFYHGSSPLICPIHINVFEDVEAAYKTKPASKSDMDRKLFFDLLNEALSTLLIPSITKSSCLSKLLDHTMLPHGKKLLDHVWGLIHKYVNPTWDQSYSFGEMAAIDLGRRPRSGVVLDEIYVIGKEIECTIFGEIVEDIVKEI